MKKLSILSVFIFIIGWPTMAAQEVNFTSDVLDTIYANDHKNVALFFPAPIRQGITGSENFVFTYNREKEQHLGLLQGMPGKESNLLVISTTGAVFSYIVKYSEELEKLNYFIDESGSIGNESPAFKSVAEDDFVPGSKPEEILADKDLIYQIFSTYLIRSKQRLGRINKKKEGIQLQVENIVFHGEELYFVLKLENDSPIDYEPTFLDISVETRQKGKKKSIQKLLQEPVFTYKMPEKVRKSQSSRFIYVLPKFSIAEDKVVVIDLKELNGERDIKLKVKKRYINNPN
ncbi:DUF4138 domain-containing protein [Antarcticibacterium flavum]|uniref:DUF4138 domain-containing protein n=1 Tax=Antarcticibacterium flavum TaxID=2058175 RepID=A0A5B7X6J7_9FLAO|nr:MULTISPECIES: DUF4138 domain-containing protein [Antarcticibacterium]MCM4160871.1 conjugal transfer protein TraN [Antarcticibacterium sp. W02-3]QCY71096.1 DUF4138 domain-containing protein [Antarcticibacterium flavum]